MTEWDTPILTLLSRVTVGHLVIMAGAYWALKVVEWLVAESWRQREIKKWFKD